MRTATDRKQYNAEYYQKNRVKLLARETARSRVRYESDKKNKLATNWAWVARNKAKHKALCARWERDNAERRAEQRRRWYAENKEHVFVKVNSRRARLLRLGGATKNSHRDYPKGFLAALAEKQRGLCAVCCDPLAVKGRHVDHIIPLASSGSNDPSNLQLLCPPCNLSKGTKDPIAFMQSRGFLL